MHYLELIKIQPEHRVFYQLLQMYQLILDLKRLIKHILQTKLERDISQLTNGISKLLQKLLKCFNCTIISISFVALFSVTTVNFCLNLYEALSPVKLIIKPALFIAGVHLYNIAINFLMF